MEIRRVLRRRRAGKVSRPVADWCRSPRHLTGPRRCQAPRTVASRPRDSTRRIFLTVSASSPCAESVEAMEVLYAVCCGLDVHKASVTACLRTPGDRGGRRQEVRTFGTTTGQLLRLGGWIRA